MHIYETNIAKDINKIANKDIYFDVDKILHEDDEITSKIIGLLLSYACQSGNHLPIMIARKRLKQFPANWISEKIKQTYSASIDISDDWDYRRLLELSEIISKDLLLWAISLGENSDNIDIAEAADDFKNLMGNSDLS